MVTNTHIPPPPPPPKGRIVRGGVIRVGAAPSVWAVLAIGAFVWAALWAKDDLAAWLQSMRAPAASSTATIKCPRPSEFETLLITVKVDVYGAYRIDCVPVAGAGAYRRGE